MRRNIGAIPVYASVREIPSRLMWPGAKFAVWRGGDAYELFEVKAGTAGAGRGMGFLPAAVVAGSAGGPVGMLVGLGISLVPFLGGLFHRGPSAQDRQGGSDFDALAAQVTQLFTQIQSKPAITQADVAAAEQAFAQLSSAAQQLSKVAYVTEHWNSAAYKPAYESRLQQIRAAATGITAGAAIQDAGASASTSGDASTNQMLLVGGAAVVVALLFLRR